MDTDKSKEIVSDILDYLVDVQGLDFLAYAEELHLRMIDDLVDIVRGHLQNG